MVDELETPSPTGEVEEPEATEVREEAESSEITEEVEEAESSELVEETSPDTDGDAPKPDKTVIQKRFDKLTRDRDAAVQRAAFLEGKESTRKPEPPDVEQVTTAKRPQEDDFDTFDEYIDKLTDWKVDQAVAKSEQKSARKAVEDTQRTAEITLKTKLDKGKEKWDDFVETITSPLFPANETVKQALMVCDEPDEVAYHLGKNTEKAVMISNMTPVAAAAAIGKLEAEIIATRKDNPRPTKTITKAPTPIKPVGASEIVQKDPEKMSHEEYRTARRDGTL